MILVAFYRSGTLRIAVGTQCGYVWRPEIVPVRGTLEYGEGKTKHLYLCIAPAAAVAHRGTKSWKLGMETVDGIGNWAYPRDGHRSGCGES